MSQERSQQPFRAECRLFALRSCTGFPHSIEASFFIITMASDGVFLIDRPVQKFCFVGPRQHHDLVAVRAVIPTVRDSDVSWFGSSYVKCSCQFANACRSSVEDRPEGKSSPESVCWFVQDDVA